jgi:methionine-rich copper-binding protein CopC
MKPSITITQTLCVAALWAAVPAPSEAHGYLVESFPSAKTHLDHSPHQIRLRFSLRADARYSTVELADENGLVLAAQAQPKTSRSFVMDAPPLSPGRYHVRYRVLSPDGDVVRGGLDFVVDE